jgi:hypothetical protein
MPEFHHRGLYHYQRQGGALLQDDRFHRKLKTGSTEERLNAIVQVIAERNSRAYCYMGSFAMGILLNSSFSMVPLNRLRLNVA